MNCVRPNTGLSSFDEEKSDLVRKYRKVSRDEAGQSSVDFCNHIRLHCKITSCPQSVKLSSIENACSHLVLDGTLEPR